MKKVKIIVPRKCWLFERRNDCDRFRFRGEEACFVSRACSCADHMEKNSRVKLSGSDKNI